MYRMVAHISTQASYVTTETFMEEGLVGWSYGVISGGTLRGYLM